MNQLAQVHRLETKGSRQGEGGKRLNVQRPQAADQGMPMITVITVVYNDAEGLEATIRSIAQQSYGRIEYIVIDGASGDGTLEVIKQHEASIDYWVSEPDKGIYDAMNKGLTLASGDLIGILNAGDTYAPDALQIIGRHAQRHDKAQFIFGSVFKGQLRSKLQPWKIHWSFDFYTCHSVGFFIRRQAQHEIGLYQTKYRCSADYDLFYRMVVKHRMKGVVTSPSELIGTFAPGGYSSQLSYLDHLVEETRIRLDNGQHRLVVLAIFMLRYLKNLRRL